MTVRAGAGKSCPVCKASVDEDKVVPIYGRGGDGNDPRSVSATTDAAAAAADLAPVPRRPAGQQLPPPPPTLPPGAGGGAGGGLGLLPALFGVAPAAGAGAAFEPLTPEQAHQAFLSRLLLMLGSFVIMCLLLF